MNKTIMTIAWVTMLVAALSGCTPEVAMSPGSAGGMAALSPEVVEVKQLADAYMAAINHGDAGAATACWTEDGEYINETTGLIVTGREAISKALQEVVSGGSKIKAETAWQGLRVVSPGVVAARGRARFTPAEGPVEHVRFVALYVRRGGRWKMHRVWQTELPVPSHYEHLAGLSWMIGEWDGEKGGLKTMNVCRWSRNRNFITHTYKVLDGNDVLITGTEVIGWDPAEERVRSWTFDSRGGFAEGIWRVKGSQWQLVEVVDVEPADLGEHQTALKGMDWLIGEWSDEDDAFKATFLWAESKAFLVQIFEVSEDGQPDQEGISIFGLDAELGQIRSWTFDTDGGFAESTWSRPGGGDEWQAKTRHVLPDGRLASSIGICRKVNNNTVAWQRIAQELDGEPLPNGPMVTQIRQPDAN